MTDFLFAGPSALSGAGRTIDFMGMFDQYNVSASPEEADARAIFSDWLSVGRDLFLVTQAHPPAEVGDAK